MIVGRNIVRIFLAALTSAVNKYVIVRGNIVRIFLAALASAVNKYVIVRRNIVRIALAALASAVYEYVIVRGNIVRIALSALTSAINEYMIVGRNIVRIFLAALASAINKIVGVLGRGNVTTVERNCVLNVVCIPRAILHFLRNSLKEAVLAADKVKSIVKLAQTKGEHCAANAVIMLSVHKKVALLNVFTYYAPGKLLCVGIALPISICILGNLGGVKINYPGRRIPLTVLTVCISGDTHKAVVIIALTLERIYAIVGENRHNHVKPLLILTPDPLIGIYIKHKLKGSSITENILTDKADATVCSSINGNCISHTVGTPNITLFIGIRVIKTTEYEALFSYLGYEYVKILLVHIIKRCNSIVNGSIKSAVNALACILAELVTCCRVFQNILLSEPIIILINKILLILVKETVAILAIPICDASGFKAGSCFSLVEHRILVGTTVIRKYIQRQNAHKHNKAKDNSHKTSAYIIFHIILLWLIVHFS